MFKIRIKIRTDAVGGIHARECHGCLNDENNTRGYRDEPKRSQERFKKTKIFHKVTKLDYG